MVEGLYFHIPFCSSKCPYCDFVSFVSDPSEEYLELLKLELKLYQELDFNVKTIYFGGGTPSLVSTELWKKFFKSLDLKDVQEITIECNPEDYEEKDFQELLSLGVNRLSFGVQSFLEKNLKFLGRKHSPKRSLQAIEQAHSSGFKNINIDIIYGLPNQSLRDLKEEINIVKDLPITHLSAYLLTPYEDTLFGELWKKGNLELPCDEKVEEMFLYLSEELSSMGFDHYEISNFAKEGYECKHNLLYWTHREFLGLGVSAWSFVNKIRFGNYRSMQAYKNAVLKSIRPVEREEVLKGEDLIKDYLFVALRTKYGVSKQMLKLIPESLREFFIEEEEKWRLSKKGWLLMNEIWCSLTKQLPPFPHQTDGDIIFKL